MIKFFILSFAFQHQSGQVVQIFLSKLGCESCSERQVREQFEQDEEKQQNGYLHPELVVAHAHHFSDLGRTAKVAVSVFAGQDISSSAIHRDCESRQRVSYKRKRLEEGPNGIHRWAESNAVNGEHQVCA